MVQTKKQGFTSKQIFKQIMLLVIFIVAFLVMHFITGSKMLNWRNIQNILSQTVQYACVAWGMIFIFGSGLVDLSIGAQVILGANVGAILAVDGGMGYPMLIIMPFVIIVACELCVMLCSEYLKIPGWVAGLGCGLVFEAIAVIWTSARAKTAGSAVVRLTDDLRALGRFPVNVIIMIVLFVICYLLINRSSVGVNLGAIGGDPAVASAVGINRRKALLVSVIIGALFVAAGAVLYLSYSGGIEARSGLASLSTIFRSLAIVMIAQSLNSFVSEPIGVLGASVFIMGLFNFLTIMRVQAGTVQEIILGAVVVVCGVLSRLNYKGVAK